VITYEEVVRKEKIIYKTYSYILYKWDA